MAFSLHPTLENDCHILGKVESSTLLLHKHAVVPWFILVPDTQLNEIYKLPLEQQQLIQTETNALAHFVETNFQVDKLNIATIGNIVPQLHIHIIGRRLNDFCWPQPVWGQTEKSSYSNGDVKNITTQLIQNNIIKN